MRRVAAALDTGAASLYVYVSGREGLLPGDAGSRHRHGRARSHRTLRGGVHSCTRCFSACGEALVAHPGIAAMTLADPPTTEAVLLLTENLLGILLAGGLDPQDAAWACDILVSLVTAVRP